MYRVDLISDDSFDIKTDMKVDHDECVNERTFEKNESQFDGSIEEWKHWRKAQTRLRSMAFVLMSKIVVYKRCYSDCVVGLPLDDAFDWFAYGFQRIRQIGSTKVDFASTHDAFFPFFFFFPLFFSLSREMRRDRRGTFAP